MSGTSASTATIEARFFRSKHKSAPRGRDGRRVAGPGKTWGAAGFDVSGLEGQDNVHHLLAVTRLLDIADLAAAAIGQSGFGDFG